MRFQANAGSQAPRLTAVSVDDPKVPRIAKHDVLRADGRMIENHRPFGCLSRSDQHEQHNGRIAHSPSFKRGFNSLFFENKVAILRNSSNIR